MNKIICKKCKRELTFENAPIATKYSTKYKGINLNFVKCPRCKTKYLVDATDGETRDKEIRYSYIMKKIGVQIKLEEMGGEILESQERAEQLLKEIKEAKAKLKEKYEGEL